MYEFTGSLQRRRGWRISAWLGILALILLTGMRGDADHVAVPGEVAQVAGPAVPAAGYGIASDLLGEPDQVDVIPVHLPDDEPEPRLEVDDRMVAALYQEGRLEELAGELERALDAVRDPAWVRRNLAIVYRDLGAYSKAAEQYEALVHLGFEDHLVDLGWALLSAGNPAEAVEPLARAAEGERAVWAHYGLGLAHARMGNVDEALHHLTSVTRLDDRFAPAFYHLGLLYHQEGDAEAALTAYRRALALDGNYAALHLHLAQLYESAGHIEQAWQSYRRALGIFPGNPEPQAGIDRLVAQYREQLAGIEKADEAARLLAVRHRNVTPAPDEDKIPTIRVGLAEGANALTFSVGGAFALLDATGNEVLRGPALERWRVEHGDGDLHLFDEAGELRAVVPGSARVVPLEPEHTLILYDRIFGSGYFYARIEHRQYRGEFEFLVRPNGLTLVNELSLEAYLYAVVPSEMYASMPLEALKAQAIAARTYTLRSLGRYASRGFDVLGSAASSEYRGVDREHPRTTRAVDETRGQVLRAGGALIDAVYSATHGGHSAASVDVWGSEHSYLQARLDADGFDAPTFPLVPADLDAWLTSFPPVYGSDIAARSAFRWVQPISADRLQAIVDARAQIGRIVQVIARERGVSGHVSRIQFVGTEGTYEVRRDAIRAALGGVRSNLFRIETMYGDDGFPSEFLIIGGGFGHGVGMDQTGAAGRAEAGQTVNEILAHYYPGARIEQAYASSIPADAH